MCLTIIEILFLIAGLWLLITGKVPAKLFGVLFGRGDYNLSPLHARLFGLLLASPLPLAFGVSFVLTLFFRQDLTLFAVAFEIIYDLLVAIIAIVIARKIKQPAVKQPIVSNPYN